LQLTNYQGKLNSFANSWQTYLSGRFGVKNSAAEEKFGSLIIFNFFEGMCALERKQS
jgi:hypothetical protein